VCHARRSVWYLASPVSLAQRFRFCGRSAALACALPSAFQVMARSQPQAVTAHGLARWGRKPLPLGFVERLARLRWQFPAQSFPMLAAFPNSPRA